MVLVSGMRSMLDLVIMSYALVAWWGVNRLTRDARSPDPVKILHVVASYLPAVRYGGTIVSVHGLCRALAARGHDVHVFTTSVDGPRDSPVPHDTAVEIDGVKVWYFQSTRFARAVLGAAARRQLRESRRASSTSSTPTRSTCGRCGRRRDAAHAAGVPYVVSPRGMLEKDLIEQKSPLLKAALIAFIEQRTLEHAAAIHVTSAREADEAARVWIRAAADARDSERRRRRSDATGHGLAGDRRDQSTARRTCCFSAASTGRRASIA